MKASKRPKTAATNRKAASGKLLLALTQLVQDKLPFASPKARSPENSSNQDDGNVRLPLLRVSKGSRTPTANGKPESSKLSLASTKLALGIRQDVRAKKVLTLKTG